MLIVDAQGIPGGWYRLQHLHGKLDHSILFHPACVARLLHLLLSGLCWSVLRVNLFRVFGTNMDGWAAYFSLPKRVQ